MPRIDDRIRHETLNQRINWKAESPLYVGRSSFNLRRPWKNSYHDKKQLELLSNNEKIDKRTTEGKRFIRDKEEAQEQLNESRHLSDRYDRTLSRSDARKFNIREGNVEDAKIAADAWNTEQFSKGNDDIEIHYGKPDKSIQFKSSRLKDNFLIQPRKFDAYSFTEGTQSIEDTADFADRLKEATKQADLLNKILNKYL